MLASLPAQRGPYDEALYSTLKSVYGFGSFRPNQLEAIEAVLNDNRDVFVLMATGGGKSVCYQIPPLVLRKLNVRAVSLIVSPLISLMQDQVTAMNARVRLDSETGAPSVTGTESACFLGSSQTDASVEPKALRGEFALVYLTPEKLLSWVASDALGQMMRHARVVCCAVDEVHCVSQWGSDFRPEYSKISQLRDGFPAVPFLALTATATPRVQEDIVSALKLRDNTLKLQTTFNRENLRYEIHPKSASRSADVDSIATIAKQLQATSGTVIVYVISRNEVDEFVIELTRRKVHCAGYHAGLPAQTRKVIQDDFSFERVQVIVATVAFGMGIDKADVRCVVHYGLPKTIENYYQETGRCGRDGLESKCILFWSSADVQRLLYITQSNADQARGVEQINQIRAFASDLETCRRFFLLRYFGEDTVGKKTCFEIGGLPCDVCMRSLQPATATGGKRNFSAEVRVLLLAVLETGQRYGVGVCVDCVLGKEQAGKQKTSHCAQSFGKGKGRSERYWKSLHQLCVNKGLLESVMQSTTMGGGRTFTTFRLSDTARHFLSHADMLLEDWVVPSDMSVAAATKAPLSTATSSSSGVLSPVDQELFERLRVSRKELANLTGVAPYVILNDRFLKQMAVERPVSQEAMLNSIVGMTEKKFLEFGVHFAKVIQTFCSEKNLPVEVVVASSLLSATTNTTTAAAAIKVSDSARRTLAFFAVGKTPLEIVNLRKDVDGVRSVNTVVEHLVSCWANGLGTTAWDWNLQTRFNISCELEATLMREISTGPELTLPVGQFKLSTMVARCEPHVAKTVSTGELYQSVKLVFWKLRSNAQQNAKEDQEDDEFLALLEDNTPLPKRPRVEEDVAKFVRCMVDEILFDSTMGIETQRLVDKILANPKSGGCPRAVLAALGEICKQGVCQFENDRIFRV
ncbi:hypothetical protein BASA81_012368 [Batrachochytrium salamandrivorans]|nr:hypothetical protein BASA81_012368 [Batrachochytrium salamandrivorans]